MKILCLTLNHETAPVELRERFAFSPHERAALLDELIAATGWAEAVVLCTCNRSEFYLAAETAGGDPMPVIAARKGLDPETLGPVIRRLEDRDAAGHLFALVCGLESMVLGEHEILGQVKEAYGSALTRCATGKTLNLLFQRAFQIAKRIRNEQAPGRHRVSVASLAVSRLLELRPDLAATRIALWGTGAVGRAVIQALDAAGARGVTVLSRDPRRGAALAAPVGGSARPSTEAALVLADCEVLLCATSAPHAVVTPDLVRGRPPDRPLLLIDLAVPRDVDPAVAALPGVRLLDIDAVGAEAADAAQARARARHGLLPTIHREADAFWGCLGARRSDHCLAAWRREAHAAMTEELERLHAEWRDATPAIRERFDTMAHRLLHRLLHRPTSAMARALREGLPCQDFLRAPATDDEPLTGPYPEPEADPEAGADLRPGVGGQPTRDDGTAAGESDPEGRREAGC